MSYRRTTDLQTPHFRLRVVEEFPDDDLPSLPGVPVVEAEGEDVTDRYRPIAKCGAVAGERKRVAR